MAASFSLIIEDDAGKQIVVPFAKDVITIGRKEGNTIRLTERNVSRFHAKLEKNTGGVLVEDLKSFNGVKLNGDRIAGKVQVSAGDVIEIGDYHLELRTGQTARASPSPSGPVGSRAAAVKPAEDDGDDFGGDTQRWDPPPPAAPLTVGATQEATVPHAPAHGGGFGGADTERLDVLQVQTVPGGHVPPPSVGVLGQAHAWPPPPPPRAAPPNPPSVPAGDLEPTSRQPIANVPLGGGLAPPGPGAAAPPLSDETQELPPVRGPPPAAAQRKRPAEETEQMRAVNAADDVGFPRLVVLNTIFAGSTFALKAMENVLGRTDDNDIVLEHRSVSRNHAKLVREGERVRILDLKSANGVLVNGDDVEQHVLKNGDVIELGRLKLRFVPIGERFVVSPDEIERARLQDAAGDETFDDGIQTANVTSPLRHRAPEAEAPRVAGRRPVVLYAVCAGLGIAVVALIIAVALSDTKTDPIEPAPQSVVGVVPADATAPPPPPAVTPAPPTPVVAAAVVAEPEEPAVEPLAKIDPPKVPVPKKREVDFEGDLKAAQTAVLAGEHKKAVEILKELEKVNPKDPRIHRNLGISYARLRENANAAKHYRKYLELNPTAPDADKVREILAGSKGR